MTQYTSGYAVVIGVGADLPVTVNDAEAIATQLEDQTRCAYPPNQIQLLTSEQANRQNILAALDKLAKQTNKDSEATAIVYFSGHGIEKPDFYLLPYEYWDGVDKLISGTEFTKKLQAIQSKKLIVLLDCCHAGGQAKVKGMPFPKSPLPPNIISEFGQSNGRVVIASSRKDEKSRTGKPYSIFTQATLKALAGYGAFERDGFARILDLALYVGRYVPNHTSDKQNPIIKVSNLESNFALAYYAGGDKVPKALDWAGVTMFAEHDDDSEQIANLKRRLSNRREALVLIQERMTEYIEYQTIPLQLRQNERRTKHEIVELEHELGINQVNN